MANSSAKKTVAQNLVILTNLLIWILTGSSIYFLLRVIWFFNSFTLIHQIGGVLLLLIHYFAYQYLRSQAMVKYSTDSTEILDPGLLLEGGIAEYFKDAIYLSTFVQVMCNVSSYFYLTLLVIPGFALYKAWPMFIAPMFARKEETGTPENRKARRDREKEERKMKGKYVQ